MLRFEIDHFEHFSLFLPTWDHCSLIICSIVMYLVYLWCNFWVGSCYKIILDPLLSIIKLITNSHDNILCYLDYVIAFYH